MALISIRKTAAIEPSPTDTVSLYVDAADNHLKQIDEEGNIIDLTDGSATSSPNAASLVNTTKAALVTLLGGGLANIKATYRITDAADGIIRVTAKTASLLTATAMKEGSDNGTGTVTAGEWGNYDLDADVFTSGGGTYVPVVGGVALGGTVTVEGTSFYQRVGNIVMCSFRIRMIPNTGGAQERFDLTLPIEPAANFGATNLVNGAITMYYANFPDLNECNINSKSGAKVLDILISTIDPDIEVGVSIHVQYSI